MCWHGETRGGLTRSESLIWWFGKHICLFLVGLELEAGSKHREAGSRRSSSDHSGLIAAEVVGQSSIVIFGLAIVYLYIQSPRQYEHIFRKSGGIHKKALEIMSLARSHDIRSVHKN